MAKITIVKSGHREYMVSDGAYLSQTFTGKTARAKAMTLFKKLSIKSEEDGEKVN